MIYHNLYQMQEISQRIILCRSYMSLSLSLCVYECMVFLMLFLFLTPILLLISTCFFFFLGIYVIVWFLQTDVCCPYLFLFFGMPQTHEYQMPQSHQLTIRIRYMYDIYYQGRNKIRTKKACNQQMLCLRTCDVTAAAAVVAGAVIEVFLFIYLPCKLHGR